MQVENLRAASASPSSASASGMPVTPLLRAEGVTKILGGRKILDGVSLNMMPGDLKVLIGPSGAGKSTFLQCLNFLLPPDEGSIWLEGSRIDARSTAELCRLRQQVGMIFQDFNLFDHLTAEENIALALRKVKKLSRHDARARARQELKRVGLSNRAGLYPAQLSGGQKQRVAIGRALAMDPKVLLLDEPTSALDPELVGEVLAVIRDLAAGGMPMVMATHHMDFARALATEILFMEAGRIIEQDSPAVLLAPGAQTRTSDFCGHLFDLRDLSSEATPGSAPQIAAAPCEGKTADVIGAGANCASSLATPLASSLSDEPMPGGKA